MATSNKSMSEPEPQNYFSPDEKHAFIVCNDRYVELRDKEGGHFSKFADIEEVKVDMVNVKAGLKRFGFGEFDIRVSQNPDNDTITDTMRGYRRML